MLVTNNHNLNVLIFFVFSYMHHLSLAYTWMYLVYLRYNIDSTIYVLWLHQTMALRLVGLAFELCTPERGIARPSASNKVPGLKTINLSIKSEKPSSNTLPSKESNPKGQQSSSEKTGSTGKSSFSKMTVGDHNAVSIEPSAIDIIAYAYYFIGLHKGVLLHLLETFVFY